MGEGIAIGCFVSFSPGKEQRVFFGVHGSLLARADELVAAPAALLGDADAVVRQGTGTGNADMLACRLPPFTLLSPLCRLLLPGWGCGHFGWSPQRRS